MECPSERKREKEKERLSKTKVQRVEDADVIVID